MKAILRLIVGLLIGICTFPQVNAQQISINNSTTCPPGTVVGAACVSLNEVDFFIATQDLPQLDQVTDQNRIPRFEAFWIPGDGNFIEFIGNDVTSDAASLNPPTNYFYPPINSANFKATAYLTGKYTNTTPPPQYSRYVSLGGRGSTGPAFTPRLTPGQRMDIHSNHYRYQDPNGQTGHLVRRGNLTAFVVSYSKNLFGKLYFFYNGRKDLTTTPHNITSCTTNVLQYKWTDMPFYFEKVTTDQHLPTTDLSSPTYNYTTTFESLTRKYKDLVMYSSEDVSASTLPENFSEKRQFPVIMADPNTILEDKDAVLSVLAILTGSSPVDSAQNPSAYQQIKNVLTALGLQPPNKPIAVNSAGDPLEYAIGATEATIYYVTGFDPNQLIVENITPDANGLYKVTFRLDICNEGQAPVGKQKVSIRYPDGAFWDLQYMGEKADGSGNNFGYLLDPVSNSGDGVWNFDLSMPLNEVLPPKPGQEHEEECKAIYFTAFTDCKGVRSLWKENGGKVVEACVVFPESLGQEAHCGHNSPIESDQFKDGDKCICCTTPPSTTCTVCDWKYCLLALLGFLLFLLWLLKKKYLPWLSHWIS